MTHDQLIIDMLNELVALELTSAPIRLLESTVFVSRLSVSDEQTITQMADQSHENAAWLTQLVLELGGVPGLRMGDVHSGDLHFLDLRFTIPHLVEHEASLIHKYKVAISRATSDSTSDSKASELLSRIVTRHQNHLDHFKAIDNTSSQAAQA